MVAAIKDARDHVNLESYIFDDDNLGEKLAALLVLKQKEGVQVNVIYDGVGSVATPVAWFDELKNVGIRTFEFHPLSSEKCWIPRPLSPSCCSVGVTARYCRYVCTEPTLGEEQS